MGRADMVGLLAWHSLYLVARRLLQSGRPVVSVAPIRIATPRLLSASAAAGVAEAGAVQQEAYAVYRYVKVTPPQRACRSSRRVTMQYYDY